MFFVAAGGTGIGNFSLFFSVYGFEADFSSAVFQTNGNLF